MQTRSTRFWIGAAAAALTWVLGQSQTSQAQLFPNLPMQRPRVPREQESPIYNMVRQNYHGYFPTCWKKFPAGWTCPCPNPEKPDYEASKAKIPLQKDPDTFLQSGAGMGAGGADDFGPLPGEGANPGGRNPGPALPGGRSPFDLDAPAPAPGANPGAAPGARPGASPFDMPAPGGAATRRSARPIAALPNIGELKPTPTNVNVAPTANELPGLGDRNPDSPPAIPDPAVGPTSASRILAPTPRKPGLMSGVRSLFGNDRRY